MDQYQSWNMVQKHIQEEREKKPRRRKKYRPEMTLEEIDQIVTFRVTLFFVFIGVFFVLPLILLRIFLCVTLV